MVRQLLFLVVLALLPAQAWASPMTFSLYEDYPTCQGCILIGAEGEIVASTGRDFEAFLRNHPDTNQRKTIVVLSSPGGSLTAGLALGRAIRSNGFDTHVGRVSRATVETSIEKSECASSCAYAYLGGTQRSIAHGSKYGLHQISATSRNTVSLSSAISGTQQVIAEISRYVEDMGVSQGVVIAATRMQASGIDWLEDARLSEMKIVNSRALYIQAPWTAYHPDTLSIQFHLPDGTRASASVSCRRYDEYSGNRGKVQVGFSVNRGIPGRNPRERALMLRTTAYIYVSNKELFSNEIWLDADSNGWRSSILKVPFSVLKRASSEGAAPTIVVLLPPAASELQPSAIALPSDGLDLALESLKVECTHLASS